MRYEGSRSVGSLQLTETTVDQDGSRIYYNPLDTPTQCLLFRPVRLGDFTVVLQNHMMHARIRD